MLSSKDEDGSSGVFPPTHISIDSSANMEVLSEPSSDSSSEAPVDFLEENTLIGAVGDETVEEDDIGLFLQDTFGALDAECFGDLVDLCPI
jgi:hypothetical protein